MKKLKMYNSLRSQAAPLKPSGQMHRPVEPSHVPTPEHRDTFGYEPVKSPLYTHVEAFWQEPARGERGAERAQRQGQTHNEASCARTERAVGSVPLRKAGTSTVCRAEAVLVAVVWTVGARRADKQREANSRAPQTSQGEQRREFTGRTPTKVWDFIHN